MSGHVPLSARAFAEVQRRAADPNRTATAAFSQALRASRGRIKRDRARLNEGNTMNATAKTTLENRLSELEKFLAMDREDEQRARDHLAQVIGRVKHNQQEISDLRAALGVEGAS